MEFDSRYGFLFMRDGKRANIPPMGVLVPERPDRCARARLRDRIFIHLSLTSRDLTSASLYQDVTALLASEYYASSGSVTAAIRKALRAANTKLMRHNAQVAGVEKQRGGVTFAVLREEEVFMAQVGAALCWVSHQGQLQRFISTDDRQSPSLGLQLAVNARFHHSWIHPGDMLVLSDPNATPMSNEQIQNAVGLEKVTDSLNNLAKMLKQGGSARIMVVRFSASQAAETAMTAADVSSVESNGAAGIAEEHREPEPIEFSASLPDPPKRFEVPHIPIPNVEVDVKGGAKRAASGMARGLARTSDGVSQLLESFVSDDSDEQAVKKNRRPSSSLLLMAVVIPILVAVIAVTIYNQRGRVEQLTRLTNEIATEYSQAQDSRDDADKARTHLEQVVSLSDQALTIDPGDASIEAYLDRALAELDRLDEVTRVRVKTLYSYKESSNPQSIVFQGLALYVLDSEDDTVTRHILENESTIAGSSEPETMLFRSQAVGAGAVGDLVDIIWLPSSGAVRSSTIAVLQLDGRILRLSPDGDPVRASNLPLPPNWGEPKAMTAFGDVLYILDPTAGRIWKFKAVDDEFTEEPNAYEFAADVAVNLTAAIDLAIDRDGYLYLLFDDGSILKYFSGQPKSFDITRLDVPLEKPTAIYCSREGLNPFFYIADTATGRIVRTTQKGLFLDQYLPTDIQSNPFTDISDVYVLESPRFTIYALSGSDLTVATID